MARLSSTKVKSEDLLFSAQIVRHDGWQEKSCKWRIVFKSLIHDVLLLLMLLQIVKWNKCDIKGRIEFYEESYFE